jgi:hypothetical protein
MSGEELHANTQQRRRWAGVVAETTTDMGRAVRILKGISTHTTHSSQQIISLSALARAHHRNTIGTARTGAPTSAADLGRLAAGNGRRSAQTSPNHQIVRQPASVPMHQYTRDS